MFCSNSSSFKVKGVIGTLSHNLLITEILCLIDELILLFLLIAAITSIISL